MDATAIQYILSDDTGLANDPARLEALRKKTGALGIEARLIYTLDAYGEGEITWDVTRMIEDIALGVFGKPFVFRTENLPPPDYSGLTLAKLAAIKADVHELMKPAIAIQHRDGNRLLCIADGNHRVTAIWGLGMPIFWCYVIPADREKDYRLDIDLQGAVRNLL